MHPTQPGPLWVIRVSPEKGLEAVWVSEVNRVSLYGLCKGECISFVRIGAPDSMGLAPAQSTEIGLATRVYFLTAP